MALAGDYTLPQAYEHFSFFHTNGADGKISESFSPGRMFILEEVRVHLSIAFVSVEYLQIRLSSAKGSEYNLVLLSTLMSDLLDVQHFPNNNSTLYLSDDHIVFELSTVSGTNVVGLNVLGWAVTGNT